MQANTMLAAEPDIEAGITRRMLERVPPAFPGWRPDAAV